MDKILCGQLLLLCLSSIRILETLKGGYQSPQVEILRNSNEVFISLPVMKAIKAMVNLTF